jgi:hypothetical protein
MAEDITVRVLPLGGTWETLGSDRLRGISAEGVELSANDWGPEAANFRVAAEAGARRPDILPYTPIEFELGGIVVWAGFVWQRPSDANGYSVGCRGWQYHLDDDLLDRVYVHTRISDWRDARSYLDTNLTFYKVAWQVTADGGVTTIGLPSGTTAAQFGQGGIAIDLGPDSTCKRIVITVVGGGRVNFRLIIGGDSASPTGTTESYVPFNTAPTTSTTYAQTFTTARRYVNLTFQDNVAGTSTGDDNSWIRIESIKVFRDTAYESGNASILKADTVVKDALALAPVLNQDATLVSAGTFSIPEYHTDGYLSPRQIMEAINSLENYRLKIGGADLKTLVYDVKPSAPIAEVGEWSGSQFSDASVSGEQIFTRAIIDGTGPDGGRLVSKRTQTGTLVDRRGYTRSVTVPISAAMTQAVADRIGDLFLTEHRTAPFSGTLVVTGNGARRVLGGGSIPPSEFLLYSGEKIRFAHRVDPDTGAWCRDGRIAAVTYRHDSRQVEIQIDDQRKRLETVLARYGVLVDQIR